MKRHLIGVLLALLAGSVAEAGDSPWTLRFHGALVQTTPRTHTSPVGGSATRVRIGAGGGIGLGLEYRLSRRMGLEVSVLAAGLEIESATARTSSLAHDLETRMVSFSLGVPFHFPAGERTDILVSPSINRLGYVDARSTVSRAGASYAVDVGADTAFGAALGLERRYGEGGWAFSAGLKYMVTETAGIDIDPWIVTLGLARRF